MKHPVRWIIGGVALVVVAALGFGAWYVFADDAPAKPTLSDSAPVDRAGPRRRSARGRSRRARTCTSGYRMTEVFAGDVIHKTAVGRTPGVSGTMTIAGNQVTAAEVTARDAAARRAIAAHATTTSTRTRSRATRSRLRSFKLTKPIALPHADHQGNQGEGRRDRHTHVARRDQDRDRAARGRAGPARRSKPSATSRSCSPTTRSSRPTPASSRSTTTARWTSRSRSRLRSPTSASHRLHWPFCPAGNTRRWQVLVAVAQVVRASGCGPEGRGFESPQSPSERERTDARSCRVGIHERDDALQRTVDRRAHAAVGLDDEAARLHAGRSARPSR